VAPCQPQIEKNFSGRSFPLRGTFFDFIRSGRKIREKTGGRTAGTAADPEGNRKKTAEKGNRREATGTPWEKIRRTSAQAQQQTRTRTGTRCRSGEDPETRQNRPGPKIRRKQAQTPAFHEIDKRTESGIRKQDPETGSGKQQIRKRFPDPKPEAQTTAEKQ
jgi:hypothetical protein